MNCARCNTAYDEHARLIHGSYVRDPEYQNIGGKIFCPPCVVELLKRMVEIGNTGAVACPNCGSPSVQAVVLPKNSIGAAVLAEYLLGTAAGVTAGASTVIQTACLKCGARWVPGTRDELGLRVRSGQLDTSR